MDIDRYIATNSSTWSRLEVLTKAATAGPPKLSPSELSEFVSLYGQVSTHLSLVRSNYSDHQLAARLSSTLAQAGAAIYGTRPKGIKSVSTFFFETFPAAVWHIRYFIAISAVCTFLPAVLIGIWFAHSGSAVHSFAPPEALDNYLNSSFGNYYHDQPAVQFASEIYFNNVEVAAVAFITGIALGIPTVGLLIRNGANIGIVAGLFTFEGKTPHFWFLVLPHGMVELTSVVLAGAAGLRIGWTVVDPGDRPRSVALADEARRSVVLVIGVGLSLLVAGCIEAFITGSTLPTVVRVGIGALAEATFLSYMFIQGRAAHAKGLTGSLGESTRQVSRSL